jgi:hypothetical protein
MRFMVIVKADRNSEAGAMPTRELLAEMGRFNEELAKAGVMLAGEGLHPSSKGARVRFSGNKRTVIDGPFAETKELVAGYWIIDVRTMAEAVEWASRVPMDAGGEYEGVPEIEVRQIFELDEFGESPAVERARELEKDLAKNKE